MKHEVVRTFRLMDNTWWNTFTWLAKVILAALDQYIENHGGYPACFDSDDEWVAELTKMRAGFAAMSAKGGFIRMEDQPIIEAGLRSFCEYYQGLWD